MRNKLVLLVFCVLFVSNSKAQQIQIEERFESAYKEIVAMLEDKKALFFLQNGRIWMEI